MHFSNVLPDVEDDAATGVRGLPHRIGVRGSALVAFGAVVAGAAAVFTGPLLAGAALSPVAVVGALVVVVIGVVGLRWGLARPGRVVFRLVMLAALALALQLAVTGLRI